MLSMEKVKKKKNNFDSYRVIFCAKNLTSGFEPVSESCFFFEGGTPYMERPLNKKKNSLYGNFSRKNVPVHT